MANIYCYWEGEKPPYIQVCEDLLRAYHPNLVVVDPPTLHTMGFPRDVWDAIRDWNVAKRSDVIRCWLLKQFGGMWCDIDCIPVHSFSVFLQIAQTTPAGVAAYDSTDNTIGVGFIAARPGSEAIERWWQAILRVIQEQRHPRWLEVSTEPFTRIVSEIGRDQFALWPLVHISPVVWRDMERFLMEAESPDHQAFIQQFPAAWCWMLCNTQLKEKGLWQWSRHRCLRSKTLLSEVFRESIRGLSAMPPPARGRAVATLNVHGDGLCHNFRQSMRAAAARWGAEFVEITIPIVPWKDPFWEKLNLDRHLAMYERVVFVDRDAIISERRPNLFDIVPAESFGVVPSEQDGHCFLEHIAQHMAPLCRLLGIDMDYTREYYNSGVMVFSPQRHQAVFELSRSIHPLPSHRGWVTIDQGLLSAALKYLGVPVCRIAPTFNRIGEKLWNRWQPVMDDFIWHFCGPKNWEHMSQTSWRI